MPLEFGNGCVVCVVLSKDSLRVEQVFEEKDIEKVEQTTNFVSVRFPNCEKEGHSLDQFRRLVGLSVWPKRASDDMQKACHELMKALCSHEDLHPFQRAFFTVLHCEEGELLGGKKEFWKQMIKGGFALDCRAGCAMECLMFDKEFITGLCKFGEDCSKDTSENELQIMADANAHTGSLCKCGVMSWKPGCDGLSSKLVATKCILGDETQITNTIDKANFPNGKTASEIFDTSKCTDKDKSEGPKLHSNVWKNVV